jgi:acyl transferase domain-containing protein
MESQKKQAIVQEAPADLTAAEAGPAAGGKPLVVTTGDIAWVVSAQSAAGLAGQASQLAEHVAARPELKAADVGWSLRVTRPAYQHRAVVLGKNRQQLESGLAAVAAGQPDPGVVVTGVAAEPGKVAFLFPGQRKTTGVGIGLVFATSSPVFAAKLAECKRALAPYVDWDLEDVLTWPEDTPELARSDVAQPVWWAIKICLAEMWQAAGIIPDAVMGQSQGEIAAAYVAGILSLEDAAKVVALRSRVLMKLAGQGAMVIVSKASSDVEKIIEPWSDRVGIGAVSEFSPRTMVCGEKSAVAELIAQCEADGVEVLVTDVDYGSHSPHVDPLREDVLAVLRGIGPRPSRIPMLSTVTLEYLEGPEAGPEYWWLNLRSAVQLDGALRLLLGSGHRTFIEPSADRPMIGIAVKSLQGTGGALTSAGGIIFHGPAASAGSAALALTTLPRIDGTVRPFLSALADAHVHGLGVDWAAVLGGGRLVELAPSVPAW